MKFIDLQEQYRRIQPAVEARINKVLSHGQYIMGKELTECEQRLADYVRSPECVTLSSGSEALRLAMMALNIGPGDEVITSSFSFFATAEMIIHVGATPVYVDIDPKTYNLDPTLIETAITSKTKAILTVDLYGQCADYTAITAIAQKHGLFIIEDAAQSFGAKQGDQFACSFGDIACTSFFPPKPLGCYGDGGACFTADPGLAKRMRQLANHGQASRYEHVEIGLNARFDTLQAAILLAKLDIFDDEVAGRQQVATWYAEALNADAPYVAPDNLSIWAQYTITHPQRDAFREHMSAHNIPTAVHYPRAFTQIDPLKPYFTAEQKECPVAEKLAEQVVSLPFHPYLTKEQVQEIARTVNSF